MEPLECFLPHLALPLLRGQTQDILPPYPVPEEDQVSFWSLLKGPGQISAITPLPHPILSPPFCQIWPGSHHATPCHPLLRVQQRPQEGPRGSAFLGPWQPGGRRCVEMGGEGSPRTRTWPPAPADPEPGFTVIPTSCCRSLISWSPGWAGPCGDTQGCRMENLKWSFWSWGWGLLGRGRWRGGEENQCRHRMWTEPRATTHPTQAGGGGAAVAGWEPGI